jgi:hypothetical protein
MGGLIMKFNWLRVSKTAGIACAALAALTLLLITTPGCEKKVDPEVIKTALRMGGKRGANYGLKKWGEKEPASANECAIALATNIKGTLVPYLDGGKLPVSAEVQAMINSTLFKNVNPAVKEAVIAVSVALDAVLPVPDTKTYLTPDQVGYIKAFLSGLQQGCDQYVGQVAGKVQAEEPTWIK